MTIKEVAYDKWDTTLDGLPIPLYLYYLDPSIYDGQFGSNTVVLGQCPDILTVLYTPLLKKDNVVLRKMPYDTKRYGYTDESGQPSTDNQPDVYRISSMKSNLVDIKTTRLYPNRGRNSKRDWRNEGKLMQYPYYFVTINDYFNEPLEILPHFCDSTSLAVKARLTLSDRCTHSLFVQGYKNDDRGNIECLVNSANIDLPCGSSAYATFMATSKNSAITNQLSNVATSLLGVGGGIAMGSPIATIGSAIGGISNGLQYSSKLKDLRNSPRSLKGIGSDVIFSRQNSDVSIEAIRWGLHPTIARQLGDFFALYGYKQDKLMNINLKSRKNYNYIKCYEVNIECSSATKEHLEKIKEVFNKGVTFWHNKGAILDYSMDNSEV